MSKTVKGILWGLLAAFLVLLVYGVFIEPRFMLDIEEQEAAIPGLPEPWVGRRVGVLGDIQEGMWFDNDRATHEAVDYLVARKPDIVFLLGDFIYHPGPEEMSDKLAEALVHLRPLTELGVPVFAVLGNHDYGIMTAEDEPAFQVARTVVDGLESIGVTVLRNESVRLEREGAPLHVVGVDSHWAGLDEPRKALEGVPEDAPRLVLFHHPDTFPGFPAHTAPFAVAGHTHGGQVRIPFLPERSWTSVAVEGEAHSDGWIEDPAWGAAGNRLYVNRGIGMSTLPVRINSPPEVTLFTLRRGEPQAPAPEQERPAAARRRPGERRE